jgi:hypothetical protein
MSGRISEGLLILLSLGAFVVVAVWLVITSGSGRDAYPPMSTYSPQPDGCRALFELGAAAGIDLQRFHDSEYDYPPGGAVAVLDNPDFSMTMLLGTELDVRALRLWLVSGGRLLLFSDPMRMLGSELFAELDEYEGLEPYGGNVLEWESPVGFDPTMLPEEEWAALMQEQQDEAGVRAFKAPKSLRATPLQSGGESGNVGALWRLYEPGRRFELSAERPPRFEHVGQLETASPGFVPYVRGDVLLATTEPLDPVVLHRRIGAGEVLWVTRSEIVANSWLDRADNHRFVLALLEHLADGGPVFVDEHLHGYVRERANPLGMLTGTTGGRLLLVLAGLATAVFFGAAVRPARSRPEPIPQRRQASEMVLAQAHLYRRARASRGVADAMIEGMRRAHSRLVHGGSPTSGEELLRWLRRDEPALASQVPVLIACLEGNTDIGGRQLQRLAADIAVLRHALER